MLHKTDRVIQFYEIQINREPEHAPPIPIGDLIYKLKPVIDQQNAYQLKNNETQCIQILEYKQYRDNIIVFLVDFADQEVSAPAYRDLEKNTLRYGELKGKEGIAISGHIAISLIETKPNSSRYRLLLETVPGINRSNIEPLLKSLFKKISKGVYTNWRDPVDLKMKGYKPSTKLLGIPSEKLKDALNNKKPISEIVLIRHENKKAFDENDKFLKKEASLRLTPVEDIGDGIFNSLKSLIKKAKEKGYDDIKITYTNKIERGATTMIGTSESDLADTLVLKKEMFKSITNLPQARDDINIPLADFMKDLIFNERK